MKAVLQRVSKAGVTINGKLKCSISIGLVILIGIEDKDDATDIEWLSNKVTNLRIFNDENNIPNLSIKEILGDILLISQFTLQASTKKGNRPGYTKAAPPEVAVPIYEAFILQLEKDLLKSIYTGEFGADMKVELINDGPMTIVIDTKNRV